MVRAVLLILVALLQASGTTLSEEAGAFMDRLAAQGFPGTGIVRMELNLLEPHTLTIYPPEGSPAGFVIGMGGNNLLDLHLRLEGDGWSEAWISSSQRKTRNTGSGCGSG